MTLTDLPAMMRLEAELTLLNELLARQTRVTLTELQALRQQVDRLINGLNKCPPAQETDLPPPTEPAIGFHPLHSLRECTLRLVLEPAPAMPVGTVDDLRGPEAAGASLSTKLRRMALWQFAVVGVFLLISALLWHHGLMRSVGEGVLLRWTPADISHRQPLPAAIRLDSLSLFAVGSAELKPGSIQVLLDALADVRARPGWLIVIAGDTDASSNAEQNLQLSRARANAVRDLMQSMGNIPESCFAVQGYGATQPIARNDTPYGRMANRRVDIRLVPEDCACLLLAQAADRQNPLRQDQVVLVSQ